MAAAAEQREGHQQKRTWYYGHFGLGLIQMGPNGDMVDNIHFGQKTPPGGKF